MNQISSNSCIACFHPTDLSREDLLERNKPRFAKSSLRAHTNSFESGISQEVEGLPTEWKPKPPPLSPSAPIPPRGRRTRDEFPGEAGSERNTRQRRQDGHLNRDMLPIFKESRELNDLKSMVPGLTLSRICQAAGAGTTSDLGRRAAVPETNCLVFSVMGLCRKCNRDHSNVTQQQAETVYGLILPGIRALLPQEIEAETVVDHHIRANNAVQSKRGQKRRRRNAGAYNANRRRHSK